MRIRCNSECYFNSNCDKCTKKILDISDVTNDSEDILKVGKIYAYTVDIYPNVMVVGKSFVSEVQVFIHNYADEIRCDVEIRIPKGMQIKHKERVFNKYLRVKSTLNNGEEFVLRPKLRRTDEFNGGSVIVIARIDVKEFKKFIKVLPGRMVNGAWRLEYDNSTR